MTETPLAALSPLRQRVLDLVESEPFTRAIIALILVNAVILGVETFPSLMGRYGRLLDAADHVILAIFVVELALRLFAHRWAFFRDPWSLFDTIVVAIALVPASEAFSVLRALRVLRVLRLVSAFPQLRRVIQGLLAAVPGLGSIAAILCIVLYIFAVVAAKLFGEEYPQWFGDLGTSLFTLFQILTLEGWVEIAREVQKTHPNSWMFFVLYILISTFAVLNLFIAVIVDAMQKTQQDEEHELQGAIDTLERKIDTLSTKIERLADSPPSGGAGRSDTSML
jgi:voltage-gated sodium channel